MTRETGQERPKPSFSEATTDEQATNNDFSESMSKSEPNTTTEPATDCTECAGLTRRTFIKGATATLAATGTATAQDTTTEGETEWTEGRSDLDFGSDYVPNPEFGEDPLTKDRHRMEWGTGLDALGTYLDDNNEQAELGGYVPTEDTANVLTVRADKFAAPDLYDFPRETQYDKDGDGDEDEPVRALDATHWATSSGTNSSISVADADADVPQALEVDATVASGEQATAAFDLSSFGATITDSAEKRFLAGVANLTLTSGTTVKVVAIDDDGDEKELKADPSGDESNLDTFATAGGNGIVFQQRMGDLATSGSGDGSFDSIQKIEIRVLEADGTITLTALNAEKMSEWVFGSYLQNEDTDSEERVERVRPGPGIFNVTDFGTLSSALRSDDAVVYNPEFHFRYTLEGGERAFEYRFIEASDYQGYEWRLQVRAKREVPQQYELKHTGISWTDDVTAPANRYIDVWTAEGVENTDFEDIDDTSKASHAGDYDSRGADVTLRSSVQADTEYGFGADILVTDANRDDATSDASSGAGGGGAPPEDQSSGSGILAVIMSIFGGGGIALGLRRLMG
jgi:hypothetical protein